MSDIPPGSSLSEVQARYGAPTVECPLPDGTRRLIWSTQPMGQYAWGTTADQNNIISEVEQILTDRSFDKVKIGHWDQDRLVCNFGPPAETSVVGMPSVRQLVWSYRYRQSGAWNSLMHIYIGPNGEVTHLHPGPDPMFDPPELMQF